MDPTDEKTRIRKMIRMMVESHPRYSAIPPQTPATILSVCDFLSLAGMIMSFKDNIYERSAINTVKWGVCFKKNEKYFLSNRITP